MQGNEKNDQSFEMDFDMGEDLGFDGEMVIEPDTDTEDQHDDLLEELGIAQLDLDDGSSSDITIDDGSDIILDLGMSDEQETDLDIATLSGGQPDISKAFLEYYQQITNARQRIYPPNTKKEDYKVTPSYSEFNYISDPKRRQVVFGVFCSAVNDLVTRPEFAKLSTEEAYSALLEIMFEDVQWTPNIYEDRFKRTFLAVYEKNKKLANLGESRVKNAVSTLVNREQLDQAELVYTINCLPFTTVSRFFADPENVSSNSTISTTDYGDFCAMFNDNSLRGRVKHSVIMSKIVSFLGSEEILQRTKISRDEIVDFSVGELLRRFIVCELESGDFYPTNMHTLASTQYSRELFAQLFTSLTDAVSRQSLCAEILCLILEILYASAQHARGDLESNEYLPVFVVGLSQFLSAFVNNSALINPIFYSYIGEPDEHGNLQLGYTDGDETILVDAPGILFDIVGDGSSVYHVPLTFIPPKKNYVLCPPPEIMDNILKYTSSTRVSVDGTMYYRYSPTFSWVSSLSIATANANSDTSGTVSGTVQGSNPLLDAIFNYNNKFDTSGEQPSIVSVSAPDKCDLIGLQRNISEPLKVLKLTLADGSSVNTLKGSACLLSEDGTALIRYAGNLGGEEVILLEPDEFTADKASVEAVTDEGPLVLASSLLADTQYDILQGREVFMRAISKRICDLNALSYEDELRIVQDRISSGLAQMLDFHYVDKVISLEVVRQHIEAAKNNDGVLSNFNRNTLQELLQLLQLDRDILTLPNAVEILERKVKELEAGPLNVRNYIAQLDSIDLHVLALQACSRTEISHESDSGLYNAIHSIPAIHSRLRSLEEQMVLIRILAEVRDDIAAVLRRIGVIFTTYNYVCTKDTVDAADEALRQGMGKRGIKECLTVTRHVLTSQLPENMAILKYFVLDNNIVGTLAELYECKKHGYSQYVGLLSNICKDLEIPDDYDLSQITEEYLYSRHKYDVAREIFQKYRREFMEVILNGVIAESGNNIELQTLKAYDILTAYGTTLFNIPDEQAEDFCNVSQYSDAFNVYVGSFILTYCPVIGEAADAIDGGYDRYESYLRNRDDFKTGSFDLKKFDKYTLKDLHIVEGLGSFMDDMINGGVTVYD